MFFSISYHRPQGFDCHLIPFIPPIIHGMLHFQSIVAIVLLSLLPFALHYFVYIFIFCIGCVTAIVDLLAQSLLNDKLILLWSLFC